MADDSVRRTSAPPEIPAEIWRRSGRPLRGWILRGAAAWTVASLGLFAPSVPVALGFVAAGAMVFFGLPWWADRRLAAIGADLADIRPHEALERIRKVEERRVLGALVPHGWAYAQRALVLLRSGDGRGADKALAECARVSRSNDDPRILRLRIEALLRTHDTGKIPELLERLPSRSPTDILAEAVVHLAKRATTRRAAELLDEIQGDLGDSVRWLAASALAGARIEDTSTAEARIDALAAYEDLEAEDPVAADLLRRARKALRDASTRGGRRARGKRERRAERAGTPAERKSSGGKRRKKDRRKERRKRRKADREKRRTATTARPTSAPSPGARGDRPTAVGDDREHAGGARPAAETGDASQAGASDTERSRKAGDAVPPRTDAPKAPKLDAAKPAKADGAPPRKTAADETAKAHHARPATAAADETAKAVKAAADEPATADDARPSEAAAATTPHDDEVQPPKTAAEAPTAATADVHPEAPAQPPRAAFDRAAGAGRPLRTKAPGSSTGSRGETSKPGASTATPTFRPPTFVPPPRPATAPAPGAKPAAAAPTGNEDAAHREPPSHGPDDAPRPTAAHASTPPAAPKVPPPPVVPPPAAPAAGPSRTGNAGPATAGFDAGWLDLVGDLDAPAVAPKPPTHTDDEPDE